MYSPEKIDPLMG